MPRGACSTFSHLPPASSNARSLCPIGHNDGDQGSVGPEGSAAATRFDDGVHRHLGRRQPGFSSLCAGQAICIRVRVEEQRKGVPIPGVRGTGRRAVCRPVRPVRDCESVPDPPRLPPCSRGRSRLDKCHGRLSSALLSTMRFGRMPSWAYAAHAPMPN